MKTEFDQLIEDLEHYYGENFVGLIIYELPEKDIIGVIAVFRKRSPLMIDDSLSLLQLVKHIYPDAQSASVITIDELKEKIESEDEEIRKFLKNIVFIYDKNGLVKNLFKEIL